MKLQLLILVWVFLSLLLISPRKAALSGKNSTNYTAFDFITSTLFDFYNTVNSLNNTHNNKCSSFRDEVQHSRAGRIPQVQMLLQQVQVPQH